MRVYLVRETQILVSGVFGCMVLMFTDNELYLVIWDVTFYFFLKNVHKETLQSLLFVLLRSQDQTNASFCVMIDEVKKNIQK